MAPMDFPPERPVVLAMEYSCGSSVDDDSDKSIAKGGVTTPFPWKLHDMLDEMAREGNHSVVTWQPHGRAFMVHKPKEFVEEIMPHYFNQTKYASFQRQLNLYGFSRLSHGEDKGAYYHMCFVRGQRNLCRSMIRQKIKGTKVRRSLSPEEEPNFYQPQWNKTNTNVDLRSNASNVMTEQPSMRVHSPNPPVAVSPSPSLRSVDAAQNDTQGPVTMIQELPKQALNSVSHSPVSAPLQPCSAPNTVNAPHVISPAGCAKAGDLLFFEGQPFRYLESIDELPPLLAPSDGQLQALQRAQRHPYKDSIHDMINSVIGLEAGYNGGNFQRNVCSV